MQPSGGVGGSEPVDPFGGGGEPDAMASVAGPDGQADGEVGFCRCRAGRRTRRCPWLPPSRGWRGGRLRVPPLPWQSGQSVARRRWLRSRRSHDLRHGWCSSPAARVRRCALRRFPAARPPAGRPVVFLGLVSTRRARLEAVDDLVRRIEEASRYVPLERLAVSPVRVRHLGGPATRSRSRTNGPNSAASPRSPAGCGLDARRGRIGSGHLCSGRRCRAGGARGRRTRAVRSLRASPLADTSSVDAVSTGRFS
jgi:hypothetical protein